jgi:serine protease AprX
VVVAAAGNRGSDADAVSFAPGNDPYVLSVGAVDDHGTTTTKDDTQTTWSSRGTSQDGHARPDVLAPGAHIVSTSAPGSHYRSVCDQCIVDGDYFRAGGSSMAAAVVSGAVAAILSEKPTWKPDHVKGAIIKNLQKIEKVPGAPTPRTLIDVEEAVDASKRELRAGNVGLTPSTLIDPATGLIDFARASWSRASWRSLTEADPLRASWSRASWRAFWSDPEPADGADSTAVDIPASGSSDAPAPLPDSSGSGSGSGSDSSGPGSAEDRANWERASWRRASWRRASWRRASWSTSFRK